MASAARRDCDKDDQQSWQAAGCCWGPVGDDVRSNANANVNSTQQRLKLTGPPWCFWPQQIVGGYADTSVVPVPSPQQPMVHLSAQPYDTNGYFAPDYSNLDI